MFAVAAYAAEAPSDGQAQHATVVEKQTDLTRLIAKATEQLAKKKLYKPNGDNFKETLEEIQPLIPVATPEQSKAVLTLTEKAAEAIGSSVTQTTASSATPPAAPDTPATQGADAQAQATPGESAQAVHADQPDTAAAQAGQHDLAPATSASAGPAVQDGQADTKTAQAAHAGQSAAAASSAGQPAVAAPATPAVAGPPMQDQGGGTKTAQEEHPAQPTGPDAPPAQHAASIPDTPDAAAPVRAQGTDSKFPKVVHVSEAAASLAKPPDALPPETDGGGPVLHPEATAKPAPITAAVAAMLQRGQAAERSGDINEARRFYQVAADSGVPSAALELGRLYDPDYLQKLGVVGGDFADPAQARHWYERAAALGMPEAHALLTAVSR